MLEHSAGTVIDALVANEQTWLGQQVHRGSGDRHFPHLTCELDGLVKLPGTPES
jgi:hypothetical protein